MTRSSCVKHEIMQLQLNMRRNYSTDMFELSPAALCSLVETHSSDTNLA